MIISNCAYFPVNHIIYFLFLAKNSIFIIYHIYLPSPLLVNTWIHSILSCYGIAAVNIGAQASLSYVDVLGPMGDADFHSIWAGLHSHQ